MMSLVIGREQMSAAADKSPPTAIARAAQVTPPAPPAHYGGHRLCNRTSLSNENLFICSFKV